MSVSMPSAMALSDPATHQPRPPSGTAAATTTTTAAATRRQDTRSWATPIAPIGVATTKAPWSTTTSAPSPASAVVDASDRDTVPSTVARNAATNATTQHTSTG